MSDIQVMNTSAPAEQSNDYLDQIIDNTQAIRRESDRHKGFVE